MTMNDGWKPRSSNGAARGGQPRRVVVDQGWDDYIPPDPDEVDYGRRAVRESREYRQSRSGGPGRFLRFALFAAVIGGVVIAGLNFFVRPFVVNGIVDIASGNSTALQIPFVTDIVRGALWSDISKPVDATNTKGIVIIVGSGSSPDDIGQQLLQAGVIGDPRAFVFEAIQKGATEKFQLGRHVVSPSMTMDQIINVLIRPASAPPTVRLTFREGLRIEQMVAELEDKQAHPADPTAPLTMNVTQFYNLAMNPPASFLAQYKWLKLPDGASLEGFLFPATYNVAPDTTPSALLGMLVDAFVAHAPAGLLKLPPDQIYATVQLAAVVETEAKIDADRALIAGVYKNRMNPKIWPTGLMDADPTLNYANDSVWLSSHPIDTWVSYTFWNSIKTDGPLSKVVFPDNLVAYNTYHHAGLPPYPICSPSGPSLVAAMTPDTTDGYLYFLAKNDGTGAHAFAKTQKEQDANLKLYGYTK
jgi:UPF0755 protein